jgi:sigma-B regulation protein RsbU (phosphoserine phosphatase)
MLKNRGIAFKLITLITSSCTFIFIVIFAYNYYSSRRMIERKVKESSQNLALATVNRIETELRAVQKIPENLADFMENGNFTRERLLQVLRMAVENNPEIYGATIAFEPYAFDRTSEHFAPYFYKSKGKIKFEYLGDGYKYFYWDWYQIPRELNRPQWSEPYFDEGAGNIIMATYSVPFYKKIDGRRQFMGIVTADLSLEWLREIVSSIKILKTGYGFLISKNGTLVTHPMKDLIMNETIFGVAEERGDTKLREIGRKMIKGESGFAPFNRIVSNKPSWMYYAPVPSSGWSLAVIFPMDEMTEDVSHLTKVVIFLGIAAYSSYLWRSS